MVARGGELRRRLLLGDMREAGVLADLTVLLPALLLGHGGGSGSGSGGGGGGGWRCQGRGAAEARHRSVERHAARGAAARGLCRRWLGDGARLRGGAELCCARSVSQRRLRIIRAFERSK